MDKNLEQKLKAETDGIINWMIEGYQKYKAEGLQPSQKMIDFLNDYQGNQDPVKQFVETTILNVKRGPSYHCLRLSKNLTVFATGKGLPNLQKTQLRRGFGRSLVRRPSSVMGQKEKDIEDTKGYSFTM